MNIPGMEGAVLFCAIQPCNRRAEGNLEFERDGKVHRVDVCPRHAEYLMHLFGGDAVEDPDILSKEIVFLDDVGGDSMIDDIINRGRPHAIIGE
ncbi:MAG: hypothetical protein LC650_00135 [Actinobacteria bacterium]|nr:hypothetical protein [Actinomycetota bacterium]